MKYKDLTIEDIENTKDFKELLLSLECSHCENPGRFFQQEQMFCLDHWKNRFGDKVLGNGNLRIDHK